MDLIHICKICVGGKREQIRVRRQSDRKVRTTSKCKCLLYYLSVKPEDGPIPVLKTWRRTKNMFIEKESRKTPSLSGEKTTFHFGDLHEEKMSGPKCYNTLTYLQSTPPVN